MLSFVHSTENNNPSTNVADLVNTWDVILIVLILLLWAAVIYNFIIKWGKIRLLEPHQPAFNDNSNCQLNSLSKSNSINLNHYKSVLTAMRSESDLKQKEVQNIPKIRISRDTRKCRSLDHIYNTLKQKQNQLQLLAECNTQNCC